MQGKNRIASSTSISGEAEYERTLFETILSKMGSRISLTTQPSKRKARTGLHGFWHEQDINLTLAVQYNGQLRSLPFTSQYNVYGHVRVNESFERIDQSLGLTEVRYHCESAVLPFNVDFVLVAPFYPGDRKLSCAPFFYITVCVTSKGLPVDRAGVLVGMSNPFVVPQRNNEPIASTKASSSLINCNNMLGAAFESIDANSQTMLLVTQNDPSVSYAIGFGGRQPYEQFAQEGSLPDKVFNTRPAHKHDSAVCRNFSLEKNETREMTFAFVGYFSGNALRVKKVNRDAPYSTHEEFNLIDSPKYTQAQKFLYTEYFDGPVSVADYALTERKNITRRIEFLEKTIKDSSFRPALKKMLAYSTQSYISNTWWSAGEPQWFTVSEGSCRFHSTIDLAYNSELFPLLYWPELLRMQFDEWSHFVLKGKYLAHDIGDESQIFGPSYSSDMPVEENANFLLLLNAYWKFTGDSDYIKKKSSLIRLLADFIIEADSDKDGLPDIPEYVANTMDDAHPLICNSGGLTYLAVKSASAFMAGAEMLEATGQDENVNKYRQQAQLIAKTLNEKSWHEDHFTITADHSLCDKSEVCMHNNNGLFYPLLCDIAVPFDMSKFRRDIITTWNKTKGRYGTPHSSMDYTIWFSQNMWRDLIAIYLGLDFEQEIDKYWDFQMTRNIWDSGCYTDVYRYGRHQCDLDNYPRGTASFGYFCGLAGLKLNRPEGFLRLAPTKTSCRLPLLPFASWEKMEIPWLQLDSDKTSSTISISQMDKLNSITKLQLEVKTAFEPKSLSYKDRMFPPNAQNMNIERGLTVSASNTYWDKSGQIWNTKIDIQLEESSFLHDFIIKLMV
ncbi:MAG: DUF4965 domain-containing protein [Actinobacteria bacterium]|nr:DUF4965 domain-containing protein [Actinomycetota bacterium]